MASPDKSSGAEECFSMAGVFQGLLNKALTEQTQGGTTSKRENNQNAEKDPPGDMVTTRYW